MCLVYFCVYWIKFCYSFCLFYFLLCGDFNFFPSYSMFETCCNIIFGIIGLLIMSIFGGGGALTWLICPTPDFDYVWHGTAHFISLLKFETPVFILRRVMAAEDRRKQTPI